MHYKDNPLSELNFNPKLNRWTTRTQNNSVIATMVFDKPFIPNKEPNPSIITDNDINTKIQTASDKDLTMHPNRFKFNLRILRPAGFYRPNNHNENDGRYQSIKIIRKIILITWVSIHNVIKIISITKNSKNTKTILNNNSSICTMCK